MKFCLLTGRNLYEGYHALREKTMDSEINREDIGNLKRVFYHEDMLVEEYIVPTGNPQVMRLIRVRAPVQDMTIDGESNMLAHSVFLKGDKEHEDIVRCRVTKALDKYWADRR